jgi:hypothetical protein
MKILHDAPLKYKTYRYVYWGLHNWCTFEGILPSTHTQKISFMHPRNIPVLPFIQQLYFQITKTFIMWLTSPQVENKPWSVTEYILESWVLKDGSNLRNNKNECEYYVRWRLFLKHLFHLVPRTFSIIADPAYCTDSSYVKCVLSQNNWSQVRQVKFPLISTETNFLPVS